MSVENDRATAPSDAAAKSPTSESSAANAAASSAEAPSPSADALKVEPSTQSAAPHHADAPRASTRTAEITIFDPSTMGAHESKRADYVRHWPLAASIAIAALLGGLAGAAATAHWSRAATPSAADARIAETTKALHDKIAQLGAEITTLKTSLAVVQRNTGLQSGKLGERVERLEKAQAEPAARLAKLGEAVDRLERRSAPAAAASLADVTGSIAGEGKKETQPLYAEGWRLRDYYAGRAVVESKSGRLFEIGPGSTLPGLGRVDAIRREDGRVVVVTRNGLIAASIEPRHIPMPYRY
jgi:hypothetical protein